MPQRVQVQLVLDFALPDYILNFIRFKYFFGFLKCRQLPIQQIEEVGIHFFQWFVSIICKFGIIDVYREIIFQRIPVNR